MSEGSQAIQPALMKRQRADGLMLPGSPSLTSAGFTNWAGQGNSLQKLPFCAQKVVKTSLGTYLFLHLIEHCGLNGNLHISKLSFSVHKVSVAYLAFGTYTTFERGY